MVLILSVAILVTIFAVWCDRRIARTYDKAVYVDALKQNYREMNELALEFSGDARVQSLTAFTGKMYYREAIDDQMIINPKKIDQFIEKMCDLDLRLEDKNETFNIVWPDGVAEKRRVAKYQFKARA